jgi:predicted transposase YbfD/YdcC
LGIIPAKLDPAGASALFRGLDGGADETRGRGDRHRLQDREALPPEEESTRESAGEAETDTRFHITSLVLAADALVPMIRSHWMIENSLRWALDMIRRDDECRMRTDNAPANLTIVKHIALNVLRIGKTKDSLRMRRKVAAWDDEALARYIAA